ncbi:LuxR C-terminal-related transcriptional regulator [Pseudomonas sp. SB113]|uniref:response regulator transcription factor n=1 Tax=Pseudomonas sp. SB113 TaxID=3154123 RepID=UPI00345CE3B9
MKITNRESAVLDFLVQGLSNKEIGRELSISDHTVRDHISSIMRKTNTTNRVELAILTSTMNKAR